MADTDGPLKRLVSRFSRDFAAWLLHAEVREVRPLNVELATEALVVDQVFHVILTDAREALLHIEFQGRSSRAPMRWRVLEYMSRLAVTYRLEMLSVVIYLGRGVGAQDTGSYQINSPTGTVALAWRYEVVRLWEMPAETLLALQRPALLPLIGQTRLTQPQEVLPYVVARLQHEAAGEDRDQLITGLLALLAEEEWVRMVEQLLTEDWLVAESPYLRRIREEGREEGALSAQHRALLTVLAARFPESALVQQQVEQALRNSMDEAAFATLLTTAVQCSSLEEFLGVLGMPS